MPPVKEGGAGGADVLCFMPEGGGGAEPEVLCFMPPVEEWEELALVGGREMSGREGRRERWGSGGEGLSLGEGLSPGEGEVERPGVDRGAAGLEPGGRRADLPTVASPAPTDRSFGMPPAKRPPRPTPEPPLLPPPPPPLPLSFGFSITGALLSLTTPTFFSLAPLEISESNAPLPFASSRFNLGAVVFAWLKVGGGGGPGGGGGGGGTGILSLCGHLGEEVCSPSQLWVHPQTPRLEGL